MFPENYIHLKSKFYTILSKSSAEKKQMKSTPANDEQISNNFFLNILFLDA
jgi:hypothetical protein